MDTDKESEFWRFCKVLGLSEEEEDEIWKDLLKMRGQKAKQVAEAMLSKARQSDRNKAYLWGLVTGKFFGLLGV